MRLCSSIPSTANAGFYRPLTTSNGTTNAKWNMTTTIDIRPRSDNGLINTPPTASVFSPYGIPYNIATQIIIPTMDIDGDDVRCRWSTSQLECGDVCYPKVIPSPTSISSNCILTITGTSPTAWYCAAIQVEDFLNTTTSQPLSSISVQFLIYVYVPRNCSSPTLSSSLICEDVQVGVPYQFTYIAINSCGASSNISDIAIQSFTGIVQNPLIDVNSNKTTYTMLVTYTPVSSQIGVQVLCARAIDELVNR